MEEVKPVYVIDACVAIKWILNEGNTKEALKLRYLYEIDAIQLIIPSFFFWEICSVLSKKEPEMVLPFFSDLKIADMLKCELSRDHTLRALKIMEKYPKISFYDASYHALAMAEEGTFITADKKYYDTTKKEGHIQLLKNLKI